MSSEPIDSVGTAKRIEVLFAARRLADFCEVNRVEAVDEVLQRLTVLQRGIYRLDSVFERNWSVPSGEVASAWSDINDALQSFGVSHSQKPDLTRDLRKYQAVEAKLRSGFQGIPPLPKYYYLKTCDVRLGRTILSAEMPGACDLASWNIADMVCEICDDVEDLDEDLSTYNGNRLLIGFITRGPHHTISMYTRFTGWLEARIAERSHRRMHGISTRLAVQYAHEGLQSLSSGLPRLFERALDEPHLYAESPLNLAAAARRSTRNAVSATRVGLTVGV
jgi:hypothetical protein